MADQFTPEQIEQFREQFRKLNEELTKLGGTAFKEMPEDINDVIKNIKLMSNEIYDIKNAFSSISTTLKNILVDFNGVGRISSSINGSFNKLVSLTSKVQEHASGTNVLSVKELKNIKNRAAIETQNLIDRADSLNKEIDGVDKESALYKKLFKQQTELNGAIEDKKSYLYTINSLIDSEITKEKDLQSKYGLTGAAIKGIAGSLQKMGVSSVFFNDLEEDVRKAAISGGSLKAAFTGVVGLAKGFGQAITDPATIMTFLVTQANKADQQTTKLAKSMMQTKFEAMQTREQFVGMANASGDAFINTDKLLEANAALGKQMGFNKVFSQDMNQTFVDLTKKIGLSEEAAGGLARISTATGRTLKATEQTIAETTSRISAQNGIQLDGKDILEESGKISGQLLANFKGNPAAIAEAVAQAKVLGTTLEQTKNQASKLLDFESSIGSQLKAELLTGQQLNLERARAYALQGNQVGVAKELTAQGMNFNKFSRLNVIQQNAFAEALGLSSDQLSDQLLKQETLTKSRSEIVALAGEEAAKRLESLSAQDKFNSAVEKLQDLLGNIVGGPLGTILDILSDAVSLVGKLISGIQSILGNTLMKGVLGAAVGFAVGGIPGLVVGGVAGLASGVMSNADDMTGYGARTLLTPTGAVALNNNDTIIAGTNLFKGNDVTSYPEGALNLGGNNSKIENLLEKLIGVSSNQQFGIDLDGRSVGTGIVRATYRSA